MDQNAYLPQVQPKDTDAVKLVDLGILGVLRVVNFRVNPHTLIVGIVDLFGFPLSL